MHTRLFLFMTAMLIGGCMNAGSSASAAEATKAWEIGTPIVTYFAGPPITDATARQMADAGFNLVWSKENELDIVHKYGMRAMIHDQLLTVQALETPENTDRLNAFIDRVKNHPAMYAYYITDEPNASQFPALGKLVEHIRKRDPAHLAYINLFPTYANNAQLGNQGDTTAAYQEHLRQYLATVKPALLSYDHYHFNADGTDGGQYFLNMEMIRRAALAADIPWLNIIQGCTWTTSMRAPNADELRWLHYTSLAYGARAISYFVYWYEGFYNELTEGGMPPEKVGMLYRPDGSQTLQYLAAKELNLQFTAVAAELRALRSLGAYHLGKVPLGAQPLPIDAPFTLDFAGSETPMPAAGMLLGYFGPRGGLTRPTHVLVVNLDYKNTVSTTIAGPKELETFDPKTGNWTRAGGSRVMLALPPGGGKLVRARK